MLGVGPPARLARHLRAAHARDVGLERQHQHVLQQADVLLVVVGDAGRLIDLRQRRGAVGLLGALDPALDRADRLQVLVDRCAVLHADAPLEPVDGIGHRVEDAAVGLHLLEPRLDAAAVAEQTLEDDARIALVGQRGRRRQPRRRVAVRAAIAVLAVAHLIVRLGGELERPQRGVGAELVGGVLVDRLAGPDVGPLGALRQDAVQPPAVGSRVNAATLVRAHDAGVAEPGHDGHAVPMRGQRRQHRRQLEGRAARPRGVEDARESSVRNVEERQTRHRRRHRPGRGRQRRHHGIEQRQGDRCAEATQHGPARQRLLGDDHDCDLLIRNGSLVTMPRMML